MIFLQNLVHKIKNIGYTDYLSDYEKKRLVIFNILNFTGFSLASIRTLYTLLLAPSFYSYWTVASNFALLSVFLVLVLMIHRHLYSLATVVSFATIPVLLAFSSLTTPDSGTEIYLILYMMLAFFFLHKIKNIIVAFSYSLLLYVGLHFYFKSNPVTGGANSIAIYYTGFNYLCSFLMIFITMYLIKFQVWKYERSIKAKKELIRLTNKNILFKTKQIEQQSALLQKKNVELTELNNIKIKLFSIISHDLRTSIYALKNIMDAFAKGGFSKEEMLMTLPGVNAEVDKCVELMDNLLSWARNQLNESKVTLQSLELGNITTNTYKLFSKKAAEKGIALINNIEPNTCAYADADMMKTILRNLIGNALKFTEAGGSVEIFSEKNNETVNLMVKDDGVGISEEALTKIFSEKYYTTLGTGQEMGTGLGLMICRDFIKSNNGKFTVSSKTGEGSCFTITLPVYKKNLQLQEVPVTF